MMRVISGERKGTQLKAVPGTNTRPTTDKVKESIFNMIGPYFDGGIALDLFAGSGGLGIEGLSRGLDKVIFVDRDKLAITTIRQNVEKCRYENHVEIFRNDAERALKAVIKRELTFSCIFLDPPYKRQKLVDLLEQIDHHRLLHSAGVIMCEHDTAVTMPPSIGNLVLERAEEYGITAISIYRMREQSGEDTDNGN